MRIKDFDEKVRIGTEVCYCGKRKTVQDIRRREHLAQLLPFGWVRCSEFELAGRNVKKDAMPAHEDIPLTAGYGCKPVIVHSPNGHRCRYESVGEAAKAINMSPSRISVLCRIGGKTRSGIRCEYVTVNMD